MAELYRATVVALTPQKGRTRPSVSLQLVQLREEGGVRRLYVTHYRQFAGRLLWDSGIAAFREGIAAPWERGQRFPFVLKASLRDVVTHDLIRLIDHDRAGLDRLIRLTGDETLDPEAYARVHGDTGWPIRDEPDHPANYRDEARLDVSSSIELPSELTVGRSWTSAAFWDA